MVQMLCGDSTGVYYIIVSSLPFKASWQRLKDFVRYPKTGGPINVEHVHIYPNSTDGWVKILGKDDARRAFEYMNGPTGVFDGRPLQVDDRNLSGPVNLRDEAPIHTSARQEYYASTHPAQSPTSSASNDQRDNASFVYQVADDWSGQMESQQGNYSPVSPVYSTGSGNFQATPIYNPAPSSFTTPQVSYGPMPPQHMGYATSMASPPATPTYQQAMTYTCLMPVNVNVIGSAHPPQLQPQYQYPVTVQEPTHTVHTKARKVIITHLPHSTTEKQLQTLLKRASQNSRSRPNSQPEDYPIESFEIPKYPDGKIRGHAFVVFFSSHVAERAVEALHGKVVKGRELKVRLAKEGAESNGNPSFPTDERREQELQMFSSPPSVMQQTYQAQPNSAELAAQFGQMYLTGPGPPSGYTTADTSREIKKEKRDKGRSGISNDADDERERRSKSKLSSRIRSQEKNHSESEREHSSKSKPSSYARAPVVVDGSGQSGRRRHR